MDVRSAFLAVAGTAREIVALTVVALHWEEPSALPEMTVGALVAHLARAVTNVERSLEAAEPAGEEPISGAAYFAPVELRPRIPGSTCGSARPPPRRRWSATGRCWARWTAPSRRLRARLEGEPEGRLVKARDEVLRLDDYLRTRIIELAVHTDDLCVSIGRATPALPGVGVAIEALVEVAVLRHGELAVLRALARRERDPDQVLRVI